MSTFHWRRFFLICFGGTSLISPIAYSQTFSNAPPPISAQRAIDTLSNRYGANSVAWIAEMRGSDGQPQPFRWEVLTFTPNSGQLLHRYSVTPSVAEDRGPENRRYPNKIPNGFFSNSDLAVDSVAAFTIAESQARKAQIGFDRCDYFLNVREYSRETVWRLELIDGSNRLTGTIYISGSNGEVLRKVWVKRDPVTGALKTEDSMAPGATPSTPSTGLSNTAPSQSPTTQQPTISSPLTRPSVTAIPNRTTPSNSGSIFKQFNPSGGGGGNAPIASSRPAPQAIATSPNRTGQEFIAIPEPDPIIRQPTATTGPPIKVPEGQRSSARISAPPIPPN